MDDTPIYNNFIEHLENFGMYTDFILSHAPPTQIPHPITGDLPVQSSYMNNNKIKCPLCRTINKIDEISAVTGLSEKCCVCLDNNVTHYFPACTHACTCTTCFNQLDKI